MGTDSTHSHVEIAGGDRLLASAEVTTDTDSSDRLPRVMTAALHVEPGQLPSGTRTRLVDSVLDLPEARTADRLRASAPSGDDEILGRIRERVDDVSTRSAGSTVLVDGTLPAEHSS